MQLMCEVLTDAERVIPGLPDAALWAVNGDEFAGVIKVKLGPVSLQDEGTGRFVDRDDSIPRSSSRAEARMCLVREPYRLASRSRCPDMVRAANHVSPQTSG